MNTTKLSLRNFGKYDAHDIEFDARFSVLCQLNGTGKTTIADAIAWVLTGRRVNGDSDISTYKPRHNTAATVVAELTVETGWNGEEMNKPSVLVLRKEFAEEWKTPRGGTEQVFFGHTTKYYINTAPMKKEEYEKELCRLFDLPSYDFAAITTIPDYFAETMTVEKRIEFVKAAVGEPMPQDIFKTEPITASVEADLRAVGWAVDPLRKSLLAAATKKKATLAEALAVAKSKTITQSVTDEEYLAARKTIAESPHKLAEIIAKKSGANPELDALERSLTVSMQNDNRELNEKNAKANDAVSAERDRDGDQSLRGRHRGLPYGPLQSRGGETSQVLRGKRDRPDKP